MSIVWRARADVRLRGGIGTRVTRCLIIRSDFQCRCGANRSRVGRTGVSVPNRIRKEDSLHAVRQYRPRASAGNSRRIFQAVSDLRCSDLTEADATVASRNIPVDEYAFEGRYLSHDAVVGATTSPDDGLFSLRGDGIETGGEIMLYRNRRGRPLSSWRFSIRYRKSGAVLSTEPSMMGARLKGFAERASRSMAGRPSWVRSSQKSRRAAPHQGRAAACN